MDRLARTDTFLDHLPGQVFLTQCQATIRDGAWRGDVDDFSRTE
jgi:hypothetical protein